MTCNFDVVRYDTSLKDLYSEELRTRVMTEVWSRFLSQMTDLETVRDLGR